MHFACFAPSIRFLLPANANFSLHPGSSVPYLVRSMTTRQSEAAQPLWQSINALTLATRDMAASSAFYEKLGLVCSYGGPTAPFSTYSITAEPAAKHKLHVNLQESLDYRPPSGEESSRWGRCVFYVSDVDAMYQKAVNSGLSPEFPPRDAMWGERYFHILDPMGHELSFARRIDGHPRWRST